MLQITGGSENVTERYHYILTPLLHFSLGTCCRSLLQTYRGTAARPVLGSSWYSSSYVTKWVSCVAQILKQEVRHVCA